MFKLMGKEINAILGAQTILIWTYVYVNKKESFLTLCSLDTNTLTVKDPIEMPQLVLHCWLRQIQSPEIEIQYYLKMITCVTPKYTMDHPDLIVSNMTGSR